LRKPTFRSSRAKGLNPSGYQGEADSSGESRASKGKRKEKAVIAFQK